MTILVTGFMPFGGRPNNTSADVVHLLPAIADGVTTAVLPVDPLAAPSALDGLMATVAPAALVLLGEASSVTGLRLERVAHNRFSDGSTSWPLDPRGTERLVSTLPPADLARRVADPRVPVEVSDDAGRFVCNALLYHALSRHALPTVFVHLPALSLADSELLCRALHGVAAVVRAASACAVTRGLISR